MIVPDGHAIVGVDVVIECACGDMFHGDTESGAITDWETTCRKSRDAVDRTTPATFDVNPTNDGTPTDDWPSFPADSRSPNTRSKPVGESYPAHYWRRCYAADVDTLVKIVDVLAIGIRAGTPAYGTTNGTTETEATRHVGTTTRMGPAVGGVDMTTTRG